MLADTDFHEAITRGTRQRIETRGVRSMRDDADEIAGEKRGASPVNLCQNVRARQGEAENGGRRLYGRAKVTTRYQGQPGQLRHDGCMMQIERNADPFTQCPAPAGEVLRGLPVNGLKRKQLRPSGLFQLGIDILGKATEVGEAAVAKAKHADGNSAQGAVGCQPAEKIAEAGASPSP